SHSGGGHVPPVQPALSVVAHLPRGARWPWRTGNTVGAWRSGSWLRTNYPGCLSLSRWWRSHHSADAGPLSGHSAAIERTGCGAVPPFRALGSAGSALGRVRHLAYSVRQFHLRRSISLVSRRASPLIDALV